MQLEGLLAYLVDRMEIRGKKALQKLVYFCAEVGVPIYTRYRMHIYGPYSHEVAEELNEAVMKDIILVADDGVTFSRGSSCDTYLKQHQQDIELYREKIDDVLNTFRTFTPMKLELYATVHFIAASLWQAYGNVTEEQVVSEVLEAKGDKFSEMETRNAFRNLVAWGWLPGKYEGYF